MENYICITNQWQSMLLDIVSKRTYIKSVGRIKFSPSGKKKGKTHLTEFWTINSDSQNEEASYYRSKMVYSSSTQKKKKKGLQGFYSIN